MLSINVRYTGFAWVATCNPPNGAAPVKAFGVTREEAIQTASRRLEELGHVMIGKPIKVVEIIENGEYSGRDWRYSSAF